MKWFDSILRWFIAGYWSVETVLKAVKKGWITKEEADEIQRKPIVPADSKLGQALIEETKKYKGHKEE